MLRAELSLRPRDENNLPVLHSPLLLCLVAAAPVKILGDPLAPDRLNSCVFPKTVTLSRAERVGPPAKNGAKRGMSPRYPKPHMRGNHQHSLAALSCRGRPCFVAAMALVACVRRPPRPCVGTPR